VDVPPPLLDCLDAVYRLQREGGNVAAGRLARRLEVDATTASERVLALAGLGLLQRDGEARILLTTAGQRLAIGLVRKHRLLERFLTDLLKLPWERVHAEACRLTPVLADDIADALDVLLGHPAQCPHGNAIPAAGDGLPHESGTPLHRIAPGRGGIIVRIEREDPELLKYLAALGLLPDTRIDVEEIAPLGGPVLVRVGAARYALGRKVAARIVVREA
jgi:DtxR family Mn-dependent transcriptional regulator